MAKIQRVKKVHLWSLPKILAIATLAAVVSISLVFGIGLIPRFVIGLNLRSNDSLYFAWVISNIFVLFACPALVAIRYHPRFRRWWHGFFFGAVYGVAAGATTMLGAGTINYLQSGPPLGLMGPLGVMVGAAVTVSILSGGLFVLLWIVSRKSRGKLKIVHGTQCPTCEYNLVGNTTYICPECGQPFTLEELDVSADDLKPG